MIALTDDEMLRYARQILLTDWDIDAQIALKNSHVLIVGMGGLGCPVAETLVRAGVGRLSLVDMDSVDESNLQRQTLFLPTDVGQPKVLVAQKRLQQINEWVKVHIFKQKFDKATAKSILSSQNSLSKLNLILDCSDNFQTRDLINQISVSSQIPLLSASAIAQTGQLALFEPKKQTGCYHCVFQGDGDDERRCVNTGVLTTTTAVMGNLQAQIALHYLAFKKNLLTNTLLIWQGETLSLRKIQYQPDLNCKICQPIAKV